MVKNKIGGKKTKKGASKNNDQITRQLLLKEDDQYYGKITNVLGSCRFNVIGMDGKTYLGILRGNLQKKVWVKLDNYVLYTCRNFQHNKVDIIHKYNDDEVRKLINLNEIPEKINISKEDSITSNIETSNNPIDDTEILFDDI